MIDQFSRTELLIGEDSIQKLQNSRVAIFGIGGVGGYTVEALARSGVGTLDLIDNDSVCITNLNRQIIATHNTLGQNKVDVAKERALDINPNIKINTYNTFYNNESQHLFKFSKYDYIVDAIDTVEGKLSLKKKKKKYNIPIICAMGAGNKMDPTKFEVTDISKTTVCPLARVIRNELKKRHIKKVKVVFSTEPPIKPQKTEEESYKKTIPGSNAFVPPVVGLIIAGEVIKDLIGYDKKNTGI